MGCRVWVQVLLEPVPGLMGSVAEVRITSASRWSVRGKLLRILHAGSPTGSGGGMVANSSRPGTSGGGSGSGNTIGEGAGVVSSASGPRQRAASPAVSCAQPALAPQHAAGDFASSSAAEAASGCSTCGAAQPCSDRSVAASSATHVSDGIRAVSSDASSCGIDSLGRDPPCVPDANEPTIAEAPVPVIAAKCEGQSPAKAPSAAAVAAASAQQQDAPAVNRIELADVLLCIGMLLGLGGVLVSGVLTLLQISR